MSEEFVHDAETLKRLQAMPLDDKIALTKQRIIEFTEAMGGPDHVCISFSGGKDSGVLAHIARQIYPDIPLVFANTGLEYPEVQRRAREMGAVFVRPKMRFDEVISTYGYPLIGKEVAEAIYYARRIRNGGERERDGAATCAEKHRECQTWRSEYSGGEQPNITEREALRGGGSTPSTREYETLESDRSFPSPSGITKLSAPTENLTAISGGVQPSTVRCGNSLSGAIRCGTTGKSWSEQYAMGSPGETRSRCGTTVEDPGPNHVGGEKPTDTGTTSRASGRTSRDRTIHRTDNESRICREQDAGSPETNGTCRDAIQRQRPDRGGTQKHLCAGETSKGNGRQTRLVIVGGGSFERGCLECRSRNGRRQTAEFINTSGAGNRRTILTGGVLQQSVQQERCGCSAFTNDAPDGG